MSFNITAIAITGVPDYRIGMIKGHVVLVPFNAPMTVGAFVCTSLNTTLTATFAAAITMTAANANVTLSPTGTGIVTISPATAGTLNNVSLGQTTPLAVTATALTATAAVALSPANANVTLSPTGTGAVTLNPATAGTINNMSVGVTTPAVVRSSNFQMPYADYTASGAAVTATVFSGRVRVPAAGSSCVVTISGLSATANVQISALNIDTTATRYMVTVASGSFTITTNVAATANADFLYLVTNP